MNVQTHRKYDKLWVKLTKKQQERALGALKLFLDNPLAPTLRLHQLKGEWYPLFSISAGGDLRIHFLQKDEKTIVLMAIGSHSQLYK